MYFKSLISGSEGIVIEIRARKKKQRRFQLLHKCLGKLEQYISNTVKRNGFDFRTTLYLDPFSLLSELILCICVRKDPVFK